jgi:hypothetical protein
MKMNISKLLVVMLCVGFVSLQINASDITSLQAQLKSVEKSTTGKEKLKLHAIISQMTNGTDMQPVAKKLRDLLPKLSDGDKATVRNVISQLQSIKKANRKDARTAKATARTAARDDRRATRTQARTQRADAKTARRQTRNARGGTTTTEMTSDSGMEMAPKSSAIEGSPSYEDVTPTYNEESGIETGMAPRVTTTNEPLEQGVETYQEEAQSDEDVQSGSQA